MSPERHVPAYVTEMSLHVYYDGFNHGVQVWIFRNCVTGHLQEKTVRYCTIDLEF